MSGTKSDKSRILGIVGLKIDRCKQLKNSREGRCVTRMFWGPFLVDRMMGG